MEDFEVQDTTGKVWRMSGRDGLHACERVADLHQVTVTAWRTPRVQLNVGMGAES